MVLNILDVVFLYVTLITSSLAISINYFQKYTPSVVQKITMFGNFAYKGVEAKWVDGLQMNKAYFSHFYAFSANASSLSLFFLVMIYFFGVGVNDYVRSVFEVLMPQQEPVTVIKSLIAVSLFTIQCWRRYYETIYLQVFSKGSKMNIFHYLLAFLHYGLCILSILGVSPLFCGSKNRKDLIWMDINTLLTTTPSILLFILASYGQSHSNIILANLRKNKETGSVVTEAYKIPKGGLFTYVSSPHRLCEIVIYLALAILLQTRTSIIIFIWVFKNQVHTAIAAQLWYKETFKNYPSERYAILPYLL